MERWPFPFRTRRQILPASSQWVLTTVSWRVQATEALKALGTPDGDNRVVTGISLTPDPAHLFVRLKSL